MANVSWLYILCDGNKIISFIKFISPQPVGGLSKRKKNPGPWARAQCAHWLRRPWLPAIKPEATAIVIIARWPPENNLSLSPHRQHGTRCRQSWSCCGRPLLFVVNRKHFVPVCIRTPGNRLKIVLWCALGVPVGMVKVNGPYSTKRA